MVWSIYSEALLRGSSPNSSQAGQSVKFADLLKYVSKLNFKKFFDTREAVQQTEQI